MTYADKPESYGRFYTLLNRMPNADKDTLVYQFTKGRTLHLSEMSLGEYTLMCNAMERVAGIDERAELYRAKRRKLRSCALHQMQLWGVDTSDWHSVDRFCQDPRISSKLFRELDFEELSLLTSKIRMMIRKREEKIK